VRLPGPVDAGERPRSPGPFGDVRLALALALTYGLATFAWILAGPALPGGRWAAVHLFTLGVLSNAILAFTHHFGRTLTHSVGPAIDRWTLTANLGIGLLLIGTIGSHRPSMVTGGTLLVLTVTASWWRLRRMRTRALGARFGWVVRLYERAHGSFIHGALLGLLLGVGAFTGPWYLGARMAHLHANVLGWGGLTLLATLVLFGPTIVRTQVEPGAADRSARHLRLGATALSIAVLLLLLMGLPGISGRIMRIAAGLALCGFAATVTTTLGPVSRTAFAARPSGGRLLVLGVAGWFTIAVWADALVVLAGRWELLDAIGVMLLAGVLAQAVLATAWYLVPILRGRTTARRDALRRRLDVGHRLRAGTLNTGVLIAVIGAVGGAVEVPSPTGLPLAWFGLLLIATAILATIALAVAPARTLR